MTEKLFWIDSYLKEFDAKITEVNENKIYLDKTAFYPTSGGQPNDLGILIANNKNYQITDVKKESSDILHVIDSTELLEVGMDVHCAIDWERRYAHMRFHTALHLFNAVIEREYSTVVTKGNQIYTNRARIDLDLQEFNRESAEHIIKIANTIAAEGHAIEAREISKKEALKIPALIKTEPGRILVNSLECVRLVEIKDIDLQMDGGTHVRNTLELGNFKLNSFENKGSHRKRVEFTLT